MQVNFELDNFESAVGLERFNNYIFSKNLVRPLTYEEARHNYHTNIEISSLLYPIINSYEILLRNRLDKIFTNRFEKNWSDNRIFKSYLDKDMCKKFDEFKIKYMKKYKNTLPPSSHHYLANLTLGVWTNFLSVKYYDKIGLNNILLNFAKNSPEQIIFHKKAEKILILRNRIAHHEPIYHLNLFDIIDFAYKFINFISPDHYQMLLCLNKKLDLTLYEQIVIKQNTIKGLVLR